MLLKLTVALTVCTFACIAQPSGNHLVGEKSPYLLLHAHNPVDWYPWGEAAFEKASREQKPIFLSIGYYTCHWCHVMERESYSNPVIAEVLNKYFVSIKVDREERPDLDRLYMTYLESLPGSAGWPANIFLTPDRKPFLGGVYFPPDKLKKLLDQVADDWSKDRDKTVQKASRATQALVRDAGQISMSSAALPPSVLDKAWRANAAIYDAQNGGFGAAPKFPRPVTIEFLLRDWTRTGQDKALDMATATLRAMARGGVYDQIGGGFHRYAVDAKWRTPHFEKMLYDQAQLAAVYCEAFQITHDRAYGDTARGILDFSLRELKLPGGGFGSALDADSPIATDNPVTAEGAFYRWTPDETAKTLGENSALFDYAYGIDKSSGIPWRARTDDELGKHFGMPAAQASVKLAATRETAMEARSHRPPPPRDDKAVTTWNAMMISALARASETFEEPRYLAAAEATANFIESHLVDTKTGRLKRSWRDGVNSGDAFLDDYTSVIAAYIDLYQADFAVKWLERAVKLQEMQDTLFEDPKQGGYFDSTPDAALLTRTRDAYDGAEPSPNSAAAMNLLRLAHISGREEWRAKADKLFAGLGPKFISHPEALPAMASALDFALAPTRHILIAGDPAAADTHALLRLVHERYLPNAVLLLADGGAGQAQLVKWLPFVEGAHPVKGQATAYICENQVCKLPTPDLTVAARLLDAKPRP
jgi:uncharacterized protein YyaL (SSP411 family)